MHLRNSCTRSMSCWYIFQSVPFFGVKGVIFLFTAKFQLTSVTRSLITGNVYMGEMVMGLSSGRESMRVLHVRRGRPLTSAEQEPHFPALQFQRTARSGARWPCTW